MEKREKEIEIKFKIRMTTSWHLATMYVEWINLDEDEQFIGHQKSENLIKL